MTGMNRGRCLIRGPSNYTYDQLDIGPLAFQCVSRVVIRIPE